jgi:hypothetical protein
MFCILRNGIFIDFSETGLLNVRVIILRVDIVNASRRGRSKSPVKLLTDSAFPSSTGRIPLPEKRKKNIKKETRKKE